MSSYQYDVLIVGGGHGSLPLLKQADRWSQQGIRTALINEHEHFYYSGMLPEYLGGVYNEQDLQIDLPNLCNKTGVQFYKGHAENLDLEERAVTTSNGNSISGRVVVFNIGARTPRMPTSKNVEPTKPTHRLDKLADFLNELDYGPDKKSRKQLVIIGGGAAGSEIALNISGRFKEEQKFSRLHITIVEAEKRLLARYPEGMSDYVSDILQQRGVDVRLQRQAIQINRDHIKLDDRFELPYDFVLWATGTTGHDLFERAGLACDDDRFVWIDETLQHPKYPWLFAAGDCSRINQHPELQRIGVHAVKQGPVLKENVNRVIKSLQKGESITKVSLEPFDPYLISPTILSTGASNAIWCTPSMWLRGGYLLRLKHLLDLRWIEQYRTRSGLQTTLLQKVNNRSAINVK